MATKYEKIDFSIEKPTKTGKYFTYNIVNRISGSCLEMQTTIFDLELDKIFNSNPVVYWLKPIEDGN